MINSGVRHSFPGAGGFVVNDQNELLVIREKFYGRPHWKLPGGMADPGMYTVYTELVNITVPTKLETWSRELRLTQKKKVDIVTLKLGPFLDRRFVQNFI